MANKMLIDAAHPEETRVVVLRGSRVEEFDFESANRRQLRGNIYLAKVTRVEPSLQAAFVEYGGNRHGFLAFSEIHPDYYQIPVADRQALIEAEEWENSQAEARSAEADDSADTDSPKSSSDSAGDDTPAEELESEEAPAEETASEEAPVEESASEETPADVDTATVTDAEEEAVEEAPVDAAPGEAKAESIGTAEPVVSAKAEEQDGETDTDSPAGETESDDSVEVVSDDSIDSVGAEDALEEVPERKKPRVRKYKIQEVIKRRQVLLVQVVKEERGNKGAALTTYLSLAGRYSVLMPNTARGGGISRKITSLADRKRLKKVATDLEVPEGMGVILRTAGASRTKAEVKRDFEYLLRLWENVRELTLKSSAPALVYEEGSLIKRSIRDLYNKDIDEVLVAGDEAYREAKDFMRMLMPSHAKNVKAYRNKQPLFASTGIEAQLDAMFSSQVTLRSGGYIVIDQTEALVSIDVNSGRSTREHNIEDTAHQTNLEASDEIARQLRLRDLAGLVVIDFIDMEEKRNNRSVERKLNEALKNDRARIQVGRISHFGLLEMSRQRIRTGVLESTTNVCPVCEGTGHVRAPSSVSLHVLRSIEDQLLRGVTHHLTVRTQTSVALYILNQKRAHLTELEERFGLNITIMADETITSGSHLQIERGEPVVQRAPRATSVQPDSVTVELDEDDTAQASTATGEEPAEHDRQAESESAGDQDEAGVRKRRRRRRRKPSESSDQSAANGEPSAASAEDSEDGQQTADDEERALSPDGDGEDDGQQRKRRRGRRGGRRGRRGRGSEENAPVDENAPIDENAQGDANGQSGEDETSYAAPSGNRGFDDADPFEIDTTPVMEPRPQSQEPVAASEDQEEAPLPVETPPIVDPAPSVQESTAEPIEPEAAPAVESGAPDTAAKEPLVPETPTEQDGTPEDSDEPKRSGWWQRRSFF